MNLKQLFWNVAPAELVTRRRREDCVAALRASVGSSWYPFGASQAVGRVGEHRMSLRRRIRYGNSFQTLMRAWLSDDPQGTRISCRFGFYWLVRAFLAFWFGGALAMCAFFLVISVSGEGRHAALEVVFPVLFPMFGLGIVLAGRYLARNERDDLLAFLRATLDARDV